MTQGGGRDWQSAFQPPAPPPLEPVVATPQAAAPERRLSAVPGTDRAPEPEAVARPEKVAPRQPSEPEEPSLEAPATTRERQQEAVLRALLERTGVAGSVAGLRRTGNGPVWEIESAAADAVARLAQLADELADALEVAEVRVDAGPTESTVHIVVVSESADSEAGKQLAVWVPVEVRDAVESAKSRTQESFTEYFLGAFNRQYGRMGEFFPRRLVSSGPMPQKRSRRRHNITTPVQLWLYMNKEQRAVLDQAVADSDAGSRSALVTKVLEFDLGLAGT